MYSEWPNKYKYMNIAVKTYLCILKECQLLRDYCSCTPSLSGLWPAH
uniref:Uncharacterized protein n=1 Tax=Anguilla anguilla TaxID=7936 RepID=A0A0E9VRX1_ANGAN